MPVATEAEQSDLMTERERDILNFCLSQCNDFEDKDWQDHGFRLKTFESMKNKMHSLLQAKPEADRMQMPADTDAERYRCLCNMATIDYEDSVSHQFVGRLSEFVDAIKPAVDEAIANRKDGV